MNVTITFRDRIESYYTRADGSAALSKDVLELTEDGSAVLLWSQLEYDKKADDGSVTNDDGREERGYKRTVLRLPRPHAVGPDDGLDAFWSEAAALCGVTEVEVDGKLVYPCE